jgi:hypothetical protein
MIGKCHTRYRVVEFRKFLDAIEAAAPRPVSICIWSPTIPQGSVHPKWVQPAPALARPFDAYEFRTEPTPTRHHSVAALKVAGNTFVEHHNANPKPFR